MAECGSWEQNEDGSQGRKNNVETESEMTPELNNLSITGVLWKNCSWWNVGGKNLFEVSVRVKGRRERRRMCQEVVL